MYNKYLLADKEPYEYERLGARRMFPNVNDNAKCARSVCTKALILIDA